MYLKAKFTQSRRDFHGLFVCNYCGCEVQRMGYDDNNFHHNVIPEMECPDCGKAGGGPITNPTIPEHLVI
ncbi:hypothetical protein [Corynebacterium stationis]|uniref:Rubredoxin n=1 Tax=Corynebacterium stationis TaxID=1705 RepID=A0AB36CLA7_9CORY|nr:hypothetical protein [Corynebacterium stationis]NME89583.1 hypothetical protein [Corynebacterium stationis]